MDVDGTGQEIYSTRKTKLLRQRAVVFFLRPSAKAVAAKIAGDPDRPPLSASEGPLEIYERRLPWYQKVAHHEIDVRKSRREQAARQILRLATDSND